MAATRHTLQREIFTFSDEKILSICRVSKTYKKKKTSFLCLVSTIDTPETFIIYQVKRSSEKSVFKKKQCWLLSDIHTVDGIATDSMDLELHIDKIYKWSTTNAQERKNFICNIYTVSFNLPQRPEFKNVPREWLEMESVIAAPNSNISLGYSSEFLQTPLIMAEYQPITDKETLDLASLMENCYYAVSNAELFMETLSKDLSILDGENIQTVLASEPQVAQLMSGIEAAITEASLVEAQLTVYDEALGRIREAMERVGQKNHAIHIANRNAKLLLEQLEIVIMQLNVSSEHQKILNEAELPGHKDELIKAGTELLKAISFPLPVGLDKLSAVAEQKKRLDKLRTKFSLLVARHLNNLFIHLGNDIGETGILLNTAVNQSNPASPGSVTSSTNDFKLLTHQTIQKELEPYTEIMKLLRALDQKAFTQLTKVYTKTMGTLYQRNFKFFFEEAKDRLITRRLQHHQHTSHSTSKSGNSSAQKGDSEAIISSVSPLISLLSNELWSPQGEGVLLDLVLDNVLSQLQPVCLAEQAFCIAFLHLDSFLIPSLKTNLQVIKDESGSYSSANSDGDDLHALTAASNDVSKLERQVNEQVRATMSAIFPTLEIELNNFISFLEKIDSFWCMYVLVRLSQHVMSAQDTGSFLSMTFASALVQAKRAFDKFMQMQQQSILDTKINRRNKCGILPYVENFGPFAKTAENIFKNSIRKIDLEKWYTKIISTMFESIVSHSTEHHKTPPEVIKMENFHHLHDLLSQLKISVLDHERKEAKQKYQEALRAYVIRYFGRPLEKLNFFFDGVQAKVGAGVKESEISYQMAFSRQELRRVVKEYPAREVKKGLEHLYRKVEKHLCEEENLLQVVWREMQGEFIAQYINIEELIQRCYPDSNVTLEFTIQNILEFFSEIAQSH